MVQNFLTFTNKIMVHVLKTGLRCVSEKVVQTVVQTVAPRPGQARKSPSPQCKAQARPEPALFRPAPALLFDRFACINAFSFQFLDFYGITPGVFLVYYS
jgi:hypothetical protein